MAFLGSVGKFFTVGPGKYIFPPATVNILLAEQLSHRDISPLHFAQSLKTTYLGSPQTKPPQTLELQVTPTDAALLASFGAYGYGGGGYAQPGSDPWQTANYGTWEDPWTLPVSSPEATSSAEWGSTAGWGEF